MRYAVSHLQMVNIDGGPVAAAHQALFLLSTGQQAGHAPAVAEWQHPVLSVVDEHGVTTLVDLNQPQPCSDDPYEAAAAQLGAIVAALTPGERRGLTTWAARCMPEAAATYSLGDGPPAGLARLLDTLTEDPGDFQPEIAMFFSHVPYGEIPVEVINTTCVQGACIVLLALNLELTVTTVLGLIARAGLLPNPLG